MIHACGAMAERVRSFNWASTSLGPISTWSTTLASYANLVLSSPQPAVLMWGDDLILLYNDGAIPTFGDRHPDALGCSYRDVFADAWALVGADVEDCLRRGKSPIRENVCVPLTRNGIVQENYYTYFLVPIYENNRIVGVYDPFLDVTQQRVDQQTKEAAVAAQKFLLDLTDKQRSMSNGREIMQISVEMLGRYLDVGRVGYSEAAPDLKSMHFETGWAQGDLQTLGGSVPVDHWGESTSSAFSHGRTVVYPDVRTEPSLVAEVKNYDAIGAIAVMAAPFVRHGVWRGSLYINHPAPRRWTPQEVSLMEEVAQRTAEAVERAQAEAELRALAERLGLAQQAGRMASWYWDLAADIFKWDGGSEWTYGRPPSEMVHPDTIFSYLAEEDRERVRVDLEPVLQGRGEYRSEFRVVWPDGSRHWIQAFGRTVWDADKRPSGVVGININVTEQKLAEAALMQTEKLAAVGRLASTMAHEINNPLEAVTNLLYLARQSHSLEEARPFMETADSELRRASTITSQALRFHRQATRPTLCTFEHLTHDLFGGRHSRIKNAGAVVQERDRTLHPVLCFEGEIRQVLNNLTTNALDALSGTGGKLLIRGRTGKDWKTGRAGMVLTVADTGSGMSKATQKKLFDAFFTTKGVGGTGLGLWVSQEIIERHAGRIQLRSSEQVSHHGTVFTIFLPCEAVARGVAD